VTGQGVERSRADAQTYADKAREALYHFPASQDRAVLDELIDFVVSRNH
jgi:heptaprenyl diphosphate synthase